MLRYTYEGIVDGVEGTPAGQSVRLSPDGESVSFERLPAGTAVELFSAGGLLLQRLTTTSDGSLSLSVADRPTGIYIVKAGRQTIKLLKR